MKISNFFIDLIFPKFCVLCQKFNTYLCQQCFESINFYPFPLKLEVEKCYLENVFVMAQYEGVTKKLITTLKYQSIKDIGITLARMIYYTTKIPQVDVITSVPLHPKRLRERGFNQATQIAAELSKLTKTPFRQLLIRTKHSQPQAKIADKSQRLEHLKNTFSLNEKISKQKLILIIDDVVTTGTTLNECAKILNRDGHSKIYGLAVAHGN